MFEEYNRKSLFAANEWFYKTKIWINAISEVKVNMSLCIVWRIQYKSNYMLLLMNESIKMKIVMFDANLKQWKV